MEAKQKEEHFFNRNPETIDILPMRIFRICRQILFDFGRTIAFSADCYRFIRFQSDMKSIHSATTFDELCDNK